MHVKNWFLKQGTKTCSFLPYAELLDFLVKTENLLPMKNVASSHSKKKKNTPVNPKTNST